ncbi:MFS transporter [Nocardiopsis baichengensis]|uniref:MFS transporter n=1 Tax=Nocardiopsis baichengensis TaxID=280240 RepID=UPI00034AAF3B|nr:MFS transporter [Nocardiopsis baichengensis]
MATSPKAADRPKLAEQRAIVLVCLAVFGLMTGQQMVNPILAPLARELGFSELALGFVMFVGASGVVLAGSFWGRRAVAWGHRTVLLISLVGATVGLLAFAVVAHIGLTGALSVPVLYVLVILTRGVVFGLAWAATPVTAQSYVAEMTSGEDERVRGMSIFGAAQGIGLAVGPAVGGLLSVAGLVPPMYAAPAVLVVITVVVAVSVPRPQVRREVPEPVRISPFDGRMWPFLTIGFGLYLAMTIVLMTAGFLLQDRLGLTANETGTVTGMVTLAGAAMIVLVQAVAVHRLGWAPLRLMRTGAVLMTVGMLVVAVAPTGPLIAAGVALLGAGLGFGMPGIMSAPSLLAPREAQAGVAGLVNATVALTFMFGPLVGNALYELGDTVPYIAGTVMLAAVVVFTLFHRGVRQVEDASSAPEPAARTAAPEER